MKKFFPQFFPFVPKFEKLFFFLHFFVNRKSRRKIARKTIGIKKNTSIESLNSNSNSGEISSRLTGASSAARESRIVAVVALQKGKKNRKIRSLAKNRSIRCRKKGKNRDSVR